MIDRDRDGEDDPIVVRDPNRPPPPAEPTLDPVARYTLLGVTAVVVIAVLIAIF